MCLYLNFAVWFFISKSEMNIVFFDIDGVIVKECGVAEFGYGFVLYMLSDPNFNLE